MTDSGPGDDRDGGAGATFQPVPPAAAATAGPEAPPERMCPACGQHSDLPACPVDGTPTIVLTRFARSAGSYEPGESIAGRYRITGPLGRGAFGAVYGAEHTTTRQPVAIKMLNVDPGTCDEDVIRRFYKEAQITAALSHPNTIRVFDFGQVDGGPLYLAMEYIKGDTLEKVIKDLSALGRNMTEEAALDVAFPVLRSLGEAHDAGLVHRVADQGRLRARDRTVRR